MSFVSPLAQVDQSSTIGQGTKVWQFASVIRGAVIGNDCNIAACSVVDGAKIGHRSLIGHGAQIHPGTLIGSDVFVGPGAIFCNDRWPQVSKEGFDLEDRNTIVVCDGASIGAGAIILSGVSVGRDSTVAAGAVCDRNVPDGMVLRREGNLTKRPDDGGVSRRMKWAQ